MVEHSKHSSLFSGRARWCLGVALAALCSLPAASARSSAATAGVNLKLDWDLMPRAGTPGVSRAKLLEAEAPELRGRILKARDQVAALERSNSEKVAYLDRHEELIQRMRGVVTAQEKVIARLAAETRAPRPEAVARPPVTATRPAAVPQVSTALAPIRLGPVELPGMMRNYATEGAFAGVVLILLGWVLYLRSVARARTAELVILKGGRSASPAAEAEPEPPAKSPEPAPRPAAEIKKEPAPARKPRQPTPKAPPKRKDSDTAPELKLNETSGRQEAQAPEPLLFDDPEKMEAAKSVLGVEDAMAPAPAKADKPAATEPRKPVTASAQRPQAPPLILDLEVDDETIDFFTDVNFEVEDENNKKG